MIQSYNLKDLKIVKPIVSSYLNQSNDLNEYITDFPSYPRLESMLEKKFLPAESRKILSDVLMDQYKEISINEGVISNINLLKDSRTFTVTTGHQLNLFSGPLYFPIKIAQTIRLAANLKKKFPGYNFVPVYWMATEDHDLEEIDHFNLFGVKRQWKTSQEGATGRMSTEGIEELGREVEKLFERNEDVQSLVSKMSEIYSRNDTLASATREFVHFLFPNDRLVIIDADDHQLKKLFHKHLIREITEGVIQKELTKVNSELEKKGYHTQLNPRDVNVFYLEQSRRVRIERVGDEWLTIDKSKKWNEPDLLKEVTSFPERFSPNAALRPVYQEFLLPNLVNIGGPGEVAYWLQLKSTFDQFDVDFPFLFMRNSHAFISNKQQGVIDAFGLTFNHLLQRKEDLIKMVSRGLVEVSIKEEKALITGQLNSILSKVTIEDDRLEGKMNGIIKGLEKDISNLESKLEKGAREKNDQKMKQLEKLVDTVYLSEKLNERSSNMLNLLNSMTLEQFIEAIKTSDDSLEPQLYVHCN